MILGTVRKPVGGAEIGGRLGGEVGRSQDFINPDNGWEFEMNKMQIPPGLVGQKNISK